jgi:hypothetical protein
MTSEVVCLVRYKADAVHDYGLQFELHGIEDKCTQSEGEFLVFLGRKCSVVRERVSRGGDMFAQDIVLTLPSAKCDILLLYNGQLSGQLFYLHRDTAVGEQKWCFVGELLYRYWLR